MMKHSKNTILVVTVAALVLLGAYQQGKLDADSEVKPAKIGVVNVTKVLENSVSNKQWQEKMQQDQTDTKNQFNQLRTELEAIQANLKLRMPGTEDFLKLRQEMVEKGAMLEAKNKFYQDKVTFEMQRWTEELYQQLLKVVADIAQDKGLDIIIADELLELPSPSLQDFMLTVKTRKLLYHNSQYDLTDEVLTALDKAAN
ncbi:MAG: OmpH family outer membrane protein [Planctomycetes bacterium]|nr:OmpH family outer membrane protein [Planctomycetota bacterium]